MKLRPMATKVDVAGSAILRERPLDEILNACRQDSARVENLVVHGPSGGGKTTLLTQANEILRLVTPTAFINCNEYRPQTVPELFRDLQDQLSTKIPGLPRCRFPRLDLALTALYNDFTPISDYGRHWPELVRRWRRRPHLDRGSRRRHRNGEAPTVNVAVEVNLLFVKFQIGAARPFRPALVPPRWRIDPVVERWFKTRQWGSLINPYPDSVMKERPGGDRETEWMAQTSRNEWLVHAFFADLREAAAVGADQYRRVVFLDDIDVLKQPAGKGGGLLALFRSVHSSPTNKDADRIPLLLVSSTPEKPHMVKTRAIPVPDFTPAEVRRLADRTPHHIDDYFPELVFGLTGGYVAATGYLLQDPAIDGMRAHNGLQRLLGRQRGVDGRTLKEHLCDSLVKALLKHSELDLASHTLEALTICSLAKDIEDVDYLVRTYGLGEDLTGLDDRRWLAWNENSGAARSARALLMRLLLHRWPTEPTWTRCDRDGAFRRLAERSAAQAGEHAPNWYYYTLGAGDLVAVCRRLETLLDLPGRETEVLDLIRHAASVPQPPIDDVAADGFTPLQRYAFLVRNRGPRRVESTPPLGHRLSRIVRIVAGKWVIEDPFESMYTRDVHLRVRTALHDLGATCEDADPFRTEAEFHENVSLERPVNPLDSDIDV